MGQARGSSLLPLVRVILCRELWHCYMPQPASMAAAESISALEEEGLHASSLNLGRKPTSLQRKLIHQADVVRVVREISAGPGQIGHSLQVHIDVLSEVRRVDDGNGDSAVLVHKRRDVDVFGIAAGIHAYGTWSSEAEVARESPQATGDAV